MIYNFAFAILIFVIIFQTWQQIERQKVWDQRERELLDRIMTRNYETFVQAEVLKEQLKRPLTPEEIYEKQYEQGIPV